MDLVGMVTQAAKKELLGKIAPMLGENENNVSSAVSSVIPSLIGALVGKASSEKGASELVDFIGKNKLDNGFMDSFGSLLTGGNAKPELLEQGGGALDFLFGKSKVGSVIDLISRFTGMKSNASGSFMKIVAPYVLGMVGNHIKKNALSPAGIANLFLGQKEFVQKATPAELAQGLGFANMIGSCQTGKTSGKSCSMTQKASTSHAGGKIKAGAAAATASTTKASGGLGKFIPFLLLAGLLWLLSSFFGKGSGVAIDKSAIDLSKSKSMLGKVMDSAKDGVGAVAGSAMDGVKGVGDMAGDVAGSAMEGVKGVGDMAGNTMGAVGNVADSAMEGVKSLGDGMGAVAGSAMDGVQNLGAVAGDAAGSVTEGIANTFKSITLPGDIQIDTPEGSFTQQIVSYLSSEEAGSRTFAFDRLHFETGSSRLTADSANQVNNFTKVLKSFPAVNIEVQGHTDNTGNAGANKALSQRRADAVRQALVTNGIDASRLASVGYGQDSPVADNGSDEGRAQNRRVSVSVTSK